MLLICAIEVPSTGSPAAGKRQTDSFIGGVQSYQVKQGESLVEIARKFDIGFNAIVAANPDLDPWVPPTGSRATIPTAWILPESGRRPGLVINIPEFRLYYFPQKRSDPILTFPLGIGDQGSSTPVGCYFVVEKIVRPTWHVPKSMWAESPGQRRVVPPGPDNPLGSHAMRLSRNDLLIHGTNRPWGIGRRSSHGCLRLYPEDIVKLFRRVPVGTQVTVMNQPVKICTRKGRVLLEVHRPISGDNTVGQVLRQLDAKRLVGKVMFAKVIRAVKEGKGVPVDVTLSLR